MTEDELKQLTRQNPTLERISVSQLKDRSPRTLVFGYHCDRSTIHVYLDEQGALHAVEYVLKDDPAASLAYRVVSHHAGDSLPLAVVQPEKRAYPEACDFEFCAALKAMGVELSFTNFDQGRNDQRIQATTYHWLGLTFDELDSSML